MLLAGLHFSPIVIYAIGATSNLEPLGLFPLELALSIAGAIVRGNCLGESSGELGGLDPREGWLRTNLSSTGRDTPLSIEASSMVLKSEGRPTMPVLIRLSESLSSVGWIETGGIGVVGIVDILCCWAVGFGACSLIFRLLTGLDDIN